MHSAFDEDYTYDDLDRPATMDRADSFDQDWTLDGLGNFSSFNDDGTSQNRTVNAANEITGISGSWKDPAYDAAGNMKFGPKPGSETTGLHYVYDAWNRLIAVYQDDGDGVYEPGSGDTLAATYKYDGANRRIEKVVAGTSDIHYYYNRDWQVVEERYVNGGTLLSCNQYIWSPRYIDAPVVRFRDGNGDGDCNPTTDAADTIRWYAGDANYNVTTTITYGYGGTKTTQHYVYSAYGEATVYDYNWSNGAAPTADGPLYCGYFFDFESGSDLARNRYYNSSLSTWISRDPIGYFLAEELDVGVGGLITPLIGNSKLNMPGNAVNSGEINDFNLYRYVHNNPLIFTDPEGKAIAGALPIAGGCACIDGPLPIGDAVACCILIGAGIYDLCHPRTCPPCPPPPPAPKPRYDTGHTHWPCKGAHTHVYWYETNQAPYPVCTCHNNLRSYVQCH